MNPRAEKSLLRASPRRPMSSPGFGDKSKLQRVSVELQRHCAANAQQPSLP
jgi:hypothetical protein